MTDSSVLMKPCIVCGEPSSATRCAEHRPTNISKASPTERGYGRAFRLLSERARKVQPWCTECGAGPDQRLTLHHTELAWLRYYAGLPARLTDYVVLCNQHNIDQGSTRPAGAPLSRSDARERLSDLEHSDAAARPSGANVAPSGAHRPRGGIPSSPAREARVSRRADYTPGGA